MFCYCFVIDLSSCHLVILYSGSWSTYAKMTLISTILQMTCNMNGKSKSSVLVNLFFNVQVGESHNVSNTTINVANTFIQEYIINANNVS